MPAAPAATALGTRLPAGAGSLLNLWSATAFTSEDFAQGLHVQFVFLPPRILLEKDEIGGRRVGDADAAGLPAP